MSADDRGANDRQAVPRVYLLHRPHDGRLNARRDCLDVDDERDFSEAEILQKQRSLKGVLEPFSTQGNLDLMRRAGFVDIMSIMKWVCFEGFLAIK